MQEKSRPYSVRPRGAPVSVFLAEAARRDVEAREAAKVDPWQSDGDEEEIKDAAVEEEEDPLRGERVHAWVRERRGGAQLPDKKRSEPILKQKAASKQDDVKYVARTVPELRECHGAPGPGVNRLRWD